MTARERSKHGGKGHYGASPTTTAFPLALAGLYAVHVSAGPTTHIYHCEPGTGRCSCGTGSGACSHIAAACTLAVQAGSAVPLLEDVA